MQYFLRERQVEAYDNDSEDDEEDFEEVDEIQDDEQEADEFSDNDKENDSDFEPAVEENEKRKTISGRPRTYVYGKNNFKWSKNAPDPRGRRSLKVYLPTAREEAKNVKTPIEAWSLLFNDTILVR